jgi:hypothetical protein
MLIIAAAGFLISIPALADSLDFHEPSGSESFSKGFNGSGEKVIINKTERNGSIPNLFTGTAGIGEFSRGIGQTQSHEQFEMVDAKNDGAFRTFLDGDDADKANLKLTGLQNLNFLAFEGEEGHDLRKDCDDIPVVPTPESGSVALLLVGIIGVTTAKTVKAILRR